MSEITLAVAGSVSGIAFVNAVKDAVGWYMAPRQAIRMAKAEAQAELIQAKSRLGIADVEVNGLIQRAEFRSAVEQIIQQANLEGIVAKAILYLRDNASPQDMNRDWILNVLDKCRNVSDEDTQEWWAKILAGEANAKGAYSRKTVNLMADLDAQMAKVFATYCRFLGMIGSHAVPLVLQDHHNDLSAIYQDEGITYNALRDLADLGLISTGFNPPAIFVHQRLEGVPNPTTFTYGEHSAELACPTGTITTGITTLTSVGRQLAALCLPAEPVNGFFEFVCDEWDGLCSGRATLGGGGAVLHYGG